MGAPRRFLSRGALVVVFVLTLLLLATPGCGDGPEDVSPAWAIPSAKTTPIYTRNPAIAFAPLINLQAGEHWMPMAPASFIANSTLDWVSGPCINQTLAVGARRVGPGHPDAPRLEARRLGVVATENEGPYSYRPTPSDSCVGHGPRVYVATQHTRPFDRRTRPAGLGPRDGFVLDVAPDARVGDTRLTVARGQAVVRGVPAFYESQSVDLGDRAGRRITYWLFYGMTVPHGAEAFHNLTREGGWERISVLLLDGESEDTFVPVSVRYQIYGDQRDVSWRRARRVVGVRDGVRGATHPVAFAARGSHANYPRPGVHTYLISPGDRRFSIRDVVTACRDCPQWRTWLEARSVRAQPWYGFGGGWGDYGDSSGTSGPLGPSRFALAGDSEPTARRVRW